MKIQKKRIRNVANYLKTIPAGGDFHVALTDTTLSSKIKKAGFPVPLAIGQRLLPSAVGPISKRNAYTSVKVHRNKPKVYRSIESSITDWRGNPLTVTRQIKVYPRTIIPPIGVELTVAEGGNPKGPIIISPKLTKGKTPPEEIVHVINLFLELFGECDILLPSLVPPLKTPIKRLNWEILPPGSHSFSSIVNNINTAQNSITSSKNKLVLERLKFIEKFNPVSVAVGQAGFNGYVAFIFQDFVILESIHEGNATYVFDEDWEPLSKKTKQTIIKKGLSKARIIHSKYWKNKIRNLFK